MALPGPGKLGFLIDKKSPSGTNPSMFMDPLRTLSKPCSLMVLTLLAGSASAFAGYESDQDLKIFPTGSGESEETELWQTHPHHLSFLPAWTFAEDGENAFTIGLDYEYRVNSFWGLGGVLEYAFEPLDTTTILAVADLHLTNSFIIQTGPGFVFEDGEELLTYRIGVLYEFELPNNLSFSPQVHYDIIDEVDNEWITALAFGWSF